MSKLRIFAFTSLIACFGVITSVYSEAPSQVKKKTYLKHKNIQLTKNGFIVMTPQGKMIVKTLRSDKKGLYILRNKRNESKHRVVFFKKGYPCPDCPKTFKNEVDLINHMNATGHG